MENIINTLNLEQTNVLAPCLYWQEQEVAKLAF